MIFAPFGNASGAWHVVTGMYSTQNYPVDTRVPQLVRQDLRRFVQRLARRLRLA
jgi:hypothetical protein